MLEKILKSRLFFFVIVILLVIGMYWYWTTLTPAETNAAIEHFVVAVPGIAYFIGAAVAAVVGKVVYDRYNRGANPEEYPLGTNNAQEYNENAKPVNYYPEKTGNVMNRDLKFESLQKTLGTGVFIPIGNRTKPPSLPFYEVVRIEDNTGKAPEDMNTGRVLVESDKSMGFQGKAADDLATLFHLVVIPKNRGDIPDEKNRVYTTDGMLPIPAHFDELTEDHIPMLREMKRTAERFYVEKRGELERLHGKDIVNKELKQGLRFGFHTEPSIGYLHLHALLGPLTKDGVKNAHKWISFDDLINRIKEKEELGKNPTIEEMHGVRMDQPVWN